MAVYDILPENNLRAEDIRDTLLANGADWSNERVKNANYLPNYFNKGAKINMFSKRKPIYSDNLTYISDEYMRVNKYGITIQQYNSPITLYEDIKNDEPTFYYSLPYKIFRLSDFCNYYPSAISPTTISKIDVVNPNILTTFHILISNIGTEHSVGFDDIYPTGVIYDGVLLSDGNKMWMGTNPLNFKDQSLKSFQGKKIEVMPFLTNFEFYNEPFKHGQIFCPVATYSPIYVCEVLTETGTTPESGYKLTVVSIYSYKDNSLRTVVEVIVYEPTNIPDITYTARYDDNGEGIALGIFDGFEGTKGTHTFEEEVGVKPISFDRPSSVTAYTDPAHIAKGGIIMESEP